MSAQQSFLIAVPDLGHVPWVEGFRRRHDPLHDQIAAHVTFVFGDLPDDDAIRAGCARVAARHLPLTLRIDRTDAAPDAARGGWYLSLSPSRPAPAVDLHGALLRHLGRTPGGFAPHLTVGRFAREDNAREALSTLRATMRAFDLTMTSLSIVESRGGRIAAPVPLA